MKKLFNGVLCVLLAITLLPVSVFAGREAADTAGEDIITVIVEVKGDAVLEAQKAEELGYKAYLETKEAKEKESAVRANQAVVQSKIKGTLKEDTPVLFTYTHIFNGFAIEIKRSDIDRIKALPNVENVYPESVYHTLANEEVAPDPEESEPYLNYGSEMMDIEYMHDRGYTGKGLVIAVVDSSFDLNHIMFSEPVAEPRLSKADIKAAIDSKSLSICNRGTEVTANRVYHNSKIPFAFNYYSRTADTYVSIANHGTHVAGIAAGNHGIDPVGKWFLGVAPDAQMLLMACNTGVDATSLGSAALLAGMEDAVKLGADVINCSFGGVGMSDAADVKAVNAARKAGVMVSCAAGNESRGFDGKVLANIIDYSSLPNPTDVSAATSVASVDSMKRYETAYVFLVDKAEIRHKSVNDSASFNKAPFIEQDYDYVYAGLGTQSEIAEVDVNGKIVLVEHGGGLKWKDKAKNAQNAGAVGMIVAYETLDTSMAQDATVTIPVAVILKDDLDKLKNAEHKRITILEGLQTVFLQSQHPQISYYSSWDTERTLELKPEIAAPGGNIYSSVNEDKFAYMSGTSMATPYFSGTTALMMGYIAANPDKYPADENRVTLIENLLMSTANVVMQDVENSIPDSPRVQGAGIANVEKAAKTPVILLGDEFAIDDYTYRKSKISLRTITLDANNTFYVPFTARNLTDEPVTYDDLSMTVITDAADEKGNVTGMRKLTFSAALPQSVTVPAKGETDINIAVTLDKAELDGNMEVFTNGFYIDGYVFLDNADKDTPMLNIPFAGFYGDWSAQPALDEYIFDNTLLYGSYLYAETNKKYLSSAEDLVLGYNPLDTNKAIEGGKEYAGISPNFDGEADDLLAKFMPLRMVGKTDYALCDADGNEILRGTDGTEGNYYYAQKGATSWLRYLQNDLVDLPDGDYIFKIYAGYYFDEPYEQDEVIEMPFYIDREAPKINGYSVSNDGNSLDLEVSDNRYIMGIVVIGETKSGGYGYATYPVEPTKELTKTIDISNFKKDLIAVDVIDYAYNSTMISNVPPEFRYEGRNGTEFSFKAYNLSGHDIPCKLILGLYLKGKLVGLTSKDEIIRDGGESNKYIDLDCNVYDTIKLFAWDSVEGMKPICEAAED